MSDPDQTTAPAAPDYRSLPLNQRRRVARELGNKIEIRKPRRRGEGE